MDGPTVHNVSAPDHPISAVTVYSECAQVERRFTLKMAKGENEVRIEHLPKLVEESIRVTGRGKATLGETVLREEKCSTDSDILALKQELDKLMKDKKALQDQTGIKERELVSMGALLDKFVQSSFSNEQETSRSFNSAKQESMQQFYTFFEQHSAKLANNVRDTNEQIEEIEAKVKEIGVKIEKAKTEFKRCYVITLYNEQGDEGEAAELTLTYQVLSAQWNPAYDVRTSIDEEGWEAVEKNDNGQRLLKLAYFGCIRQTSGEDWNGVNLTLSTAKQLQRGISLPTVDKMRVVFEKNECTMFGQAQPHTQQASYGSAFFGGTVTTAAHTNTHTLFGLQPQQQQQRQIMPQPPVLPPMPTEKASTVEDQVVASNFSVPLRKSIPSDGKTHKVTIACLELVAPVRFQCTPSKSSAVFMSATVRNSSDFLLLPGNAFIYVDNSFIQKIQLKQVLPGEQFTVPLGICEAVRVTPGEVKREQTVKGALIAQHASLEHKQQIRVKNARKDSLKLTIWEPIPKSSEPKIQIKLVSPNLEEKEGNAAEKGARLNEDGTLEWTMCLKEKEERKLLVHWEAEYPLAEKLAFKK